jgi:hypothetical protein
MKCVSVKTAQYSTKKEQELEFQCVHDSGGSPENAAFFAFTPSGTLKLSCVNPTDFEAGKFYYVDINEAAE